jgi:hypothetical protein
MGGTGMATTSGRGAPTAVYLELGKRRVFAGALEWPGWARFDRTEELALDALARYVPRYAVVARRAGIDFPPGVADGLVVTERLPGSGMTDFGAPGEIAAADAEPLDAEGAARIADLVAASWVVLDEVAAGAPAELRKGPRGGGRDRDGIVAHVLDAEVAYARKLGIRRQPAIDDGAAIAALRDEITTALREPSDGTPPVQKGWPPRYAARRIAWHVLDHAWEIQDRSDPFG